MASNDLVNEYIANGGTDVAGVMHDDDLTLLEKIQKLKGKITDDPTAKQTLTTGADPTTLVQGVNPELDDMEPLKPGTMTDDELAKWLVDYPKSNDAKAETILRSMTDKRDFITNLIDPTTRNYTAGRVLGQAGAGAVSSMDPQVTYPALYGLATKPLDMMGLKVGSDEALNVAASRSRKEAGAFGVGDPRNLVESGANILGSMVPVPGPKNLGKVGNIIEAVTPMVVGPTIPKIAVNATIALGMEQSMRELNDNKTDTYGTLFDTIGLPDVSPEQQAANDPTIHAISDIGMAALLMTPIVAPLAIKAWQNFKPAKPRVVMPIQSVDPSGPANLATLETAGDQHMAQIFDDKDVLINIARQSGVLNPDELANNIDINTQMSAKNKVEHGVNSGVMRGQFGDWTSPVPPRTFHQSYKELAPDVQKEYDDYMKLGDYADDLRLQMNHPKGDPNAKANLAQTQKTRADLRAKYPLLAQWSQQYHQIMESNHDFQTKGTYSSLSRKGKKELLTQRPHFVPNDPDFIDPKKPLLERMAQKGKQAKSPTNETEYGWMNKRDYLSTKGIDGRKNSVDALVEYTRAVLNDQLQNNVKGAYVDALGKSKINVSRRNGRKAPLIRKAKPGEAQTFNTRVVTIRRGGKREQHLTGQLQAQILRLDPYIVHGVWGTTLVNSRRAFEHGTTGVKSIVFAPTTWIRDTLSGFANAGPGEAGPGPSAIWAPANILSAKARDAFVTTAEARLGAGKAGIPGLSPQATQALVQRAASSLQNTMYTMAAEQGGYDGGIMRTRIQTAKGALSELTRNMPPWVGKSWGYSFGPLAKGLSAVFDSMQEAPRHSSFTRDIKAGASPEQAAINARRMTGDNNRSGRVYNAQGKMITADATNPSMQAFDPVLGKIIEGARQAVPYLNPALQGMKRAYGQAYKDPMRFAVRNWISVGIPAIASMAWNSMLTRDNPDGYDYTKHMFENRTVRDQVMEPFYFGIPGQDPSKGVSIPIAHEQVWFAPVLQQLLQHFMSSDPEADQAATDFGLTLLTQGLPLSIPPMMGAAMALTTGQAPPQLGGNSYPIREDNSGFLPQNVEVAIRTLWGSGAAFNLDAANALHDSGGNPEAAAEEWMDSVLSKTPVVKGVIGLRNTSTFNTPITSENQRKLDAVDAFDKGWSLHYDQQGLLGKMPFDEGPTMDDPLAPFGVLPTPKPTNPLYEIFGEQIHKQMKSGDMKTLFARGGLMTKQIQILDTFNVGKREAWRKQQEDLKRAPEEAKAATEAADAARAAYAAVPPGTKENPKSKTPEGQAKDAAEELELYWTEQARTNKILEDNNLDMGNAYDVSKLRAMLEDEHRAIQGQQLAAIKEIEDQITQEMIAKGMLKPGQRFVMERDLAPITQPVQDQSQARVTPR